MRSYLDFEQPIAEIEGRIEELRHQAGNGDVNIADEVGRLQSRAERLLRQSYQRLSAWQKTQVSRHPERPHALDYIAGLIEDFTPLAGDRVTGEDPAVVGGLGRFRGASVVVIGHEKGADATQRLRHNFGIARPEGYRKAQRLMRLADHFHLPVVTLIDTPRAHAAASEPVARTIETALGLEVPLVAVVIGEGGGVGALAFAVANRLLMLEHSVLSPVPPEEASALLWGDDERASEAAEALRMTADDLRELGIADVVVPEPLGGAHRDPKASLSATGEAIGRALDELASRDGGHLKASRRDKLAQLGRNTL